jgi:hypothetical protein
MEGKRVKKKCVMRGGRDRRKRRKNSSLERKNIKAKKGINNRWKETVKDDRAT